MKAPSPGKVQVLPNASFIKHCWGGMAQAIFGSLTALVVGFVILFMSLMAINPGIAYQQEEVKEDQPVLVEYYLPYPGILPDSPLYRLKALRDKLSLAVTLDENKKAEKELLFADKRIKAAEALIGGNKQSLGVSTATKAEKYLESAANRAIKMQQQGKDAKSLLLTLEKASAKHAVMLEEFMLSMENEDKKVLENTLTGTKTIQDLVKQAIRESR